MEPSDRRSEELELAAALKHDLGKSIAWETAMIDATKRCAPGSRQLHRAIRQDLVRTRRGSDGSTRNALEIWNEFLPELQSERFREFVELRLVADQLQVIQSLWPVLVDDSADLVPHVETLLKAQFEIREALVAFQRRLRAQEASDTWQEF